MNTVTFKSRSKIKIGKLIKVAKDMGIEPIEERELTDEEMALPGPKVNNKALENWLEKDSGESYGIEEAFAHIKKELHKAKGKR